MIEVLSWGDKIRRGTYRLHSRFASAVNFVSGEDFIFVVTAEIGAGPCSIVLRGRIDGLLDSLEVHEDYLSFEEERTYFSESRVYRSAIEIPFCDSGVLKRSLEFFGKAIVEHASAKSLAFLLMPERKSAFKSSFEKAYVEKFEEAYTKLLDGNIHVAVRMVKGLGPGLTPSGDDFNAGLLTAMNVTRMIPPDSGERTRIPSAPFVKGGEANGLINSIYEEARGDNSFTNALLGYAARGWVGEKCKRLVESLFVGDEKETDRDTKALLTMGETSGADFGVGLWTGLKGFGI